MSVPPRLTAGRSVLSAQGVCAIVGAGLSEERLANAIEVLFRCNAFMRKRRNKRGKPQEEDRTRQTHDG